MADRVIKSVTCYNKQMVCEQITKWMNNGWNIHNFFIQIVPTKTTTVEEFTIFYDSMLDGGIR